MIARQMAEDAVAELKTVQPLVLMSPSHWASLTKSLANAFDIRLDYYWRDQGVRDALTAQYERHMNERQKDWPEKERVKFRLERFRQYERLGVSPTRMATPDDRNPQE
jgi:hypothetical protein